jgi:hypothetical protein
MWPHGDTHMLANTASGTNERKKKTLANTIYIHLIYMVYIYNMDTDYACFAVHVFMHTHTHTHTE